MCTKLVRGGTYSKGERLSVKCDRSTNLVFEHKIGYNSVYRRYVPDSCTKPGVFEVNQFHGVIRIGSRPTSVAMITKSWLFGRKIGYNSARIGEVPDLCQSGVLGVGQCNGIIQTRH